MTFRFPQPVFGPPDAPAGDPPPSNPPAAPPAGDPPAPATMPEGLPAEFWDQQTATVNFKNLTAHIGELRQFKQERDEANAALEARKPEDIRFEVKLPDTVKVPEGLELKIDDKDPRIAPLRELAMKHRLPQEAIDELVAMDAQIQIAAHNEADAEIQAEMKKLGDNGPARVKAVEDFLQANVSKDEYAALRPVIGNATAFAGVEKLIAKATAQNIPGAQPPANPAPPPKRLADRMYPTSVQPPQQKAS